MGWVTDLMKELPLSAVLRERLTVADNKVASLEAALVQCAAEKKNLEVLLGQARAEIEQVRRLHDDANKEQLQQANALTADRLLVLRAICFHKDMDAAQIAGICGLAPQVAEWHIDALRARHLIDNCITAGSSWSDGGITYSISPKGRDALAERNMLAPG